MDVLKHLFERHFGSSVLQAQPLQGGLGGSGRTIVRLTGSNATAIGILHDVREENAAFLAFSRHFRAHGLPVPEIYAEDLAHGAYLEQDLGDTTLFHLLTTDRPGPALAAEALAAYRQVVEFLPRFQVEAGRDLDYRLCYPRPAFDRQSIAWDLNYFKYYFLKLAGVPFNEQALEDDFSRLTRFLLTAPRDFFLYRDFQSRNIMMLAGRPFFLDYQGGRKGALHYDIASLLFDAKADLPPDLRRQLLDHYLAALATFLPVSRDAFLHHYYAFVYVRITQSLGTYGFRGFYERKPHFLQSVPYALNNLRWLQENVELPLALPTLLATYRSMMASEKLRELPEAATPAGAAAAALQPPLASAARILTLEILSFSFHQGGPPRDESGHGGGFVFDARCLPNPGREPRFAALSGKDAPVIDYLEGEESVRRFLYHALSLVEAGVADYQQRGFHHLMVSFGCTGGRHRSVYLAEQLAGRLRGRPGLEIVLRHLELEKAPS